MNNGIGAFEGAGDRIGIANVADDQLGIRG
jgi:hypothetical protein